MKKTIVMMSVVGAIVCAVMAGQTTVDMADYGTTASITNNISLGTVTHTEAFLTYDGSGITNDVVFYATVGGIDYRLGTSMVTNGKYDHVDLLDLPLSALGILKITTTQTNLNIRLVDAEL